VAHLKRVLRVAAVASSIAIFGMYLTHEVRRRSVLNAQTTLPAKTVAPSTQPQMMISGSKSAVVFPSPSPSASAQPLPAGTTQPRQMIMPGSKSNIHVIEGDVMFSDGNVTIQPTTNPGKP
jgi:hypothetical protein